MRFLLDMNASGALLSLLRGSGHDVTCVRDVDRKMSDSDILAWAVREQRIITALCVFKTYNNNSGQNNFGDEQTRLNI